MQNQENKPSIPMPRREIPESWVKNGRCPACGAANLKLTHLSDVPDYLSCSKCGISFEVENGGRYVRLKHVPDELEFVDEILRNRWVESSKLAGIIARHRPVAEEKKAPDQLSAASPTDDAWKRALRMYQLGNNPRTIQTMLIQSGLNQEQVDVILARLKRVAEDETQQQNKKFWIVAGISLFVLVLLTGMWLATSGKVPVLFGTVTATPVPTQDPNQPSAVTMLMKLIPAGAQPNLSNLPDPTVETGKGPAKAACPGTPESAARLFGGDPSLWYRDVDEIPSWQMTNSGTAISVKVPAGMTAAYLANRSFKALSIRGPATIYNVNFLVITCD
ncbi:hypothetical protein ANAEL_05267 [Anaerolineales bacterium]|nr:hypothetical protein ANAEL_05267 [Anaerolineales bacterium]